MKNIHMIAEAHLDPMWLWRWEEGYAEALSTFRTAIELMDEFPEFLFCHNESVLYEWVKEADPALFDKISKRVEEGRWVIASGWFLQPDCNMPSGESIVRNILRGRKFFSENFPNVKHTDTAINFDSFGHSKGIVQILNQAGYDAYIVCRPGKNDFDFPEQDFIWKGFAGSEVNVHRSDENYNSVWGHAADELRLFLDKKKEEAVTLFLWGVGDHGGGATREDLLQFHTLITGEGKDAVPAPKELVLSDGFSYSEIPEDVVTDASWAENIHIIHSDPDAYFREFRALDKTCPTIDKGLNPVADGCYTSQIRVKTKHRELENALYSAEKMAVAASCQTDFKYPFERFKEAERSLLFAEFHDGLPGSGSPLVEEDTVRILEHGLEIAAQEKVRAFSYLTLGEPRIKDGASVIQFFNPHPFDIEGDFTCECSLPRQNWTTDFLYPEVYYGDASDHPGERVPAQADKEVSNFAIDWRKKVVIHAVLKASSVTRFDVRWKSLNGGRPTYDSIEDKGDFVFENSRIKVVIDMSTGLISEYSVDGIKILQGGSSRLELTDDGYNPWGLHSTNTHLKRTFQLLTPLEATKFIGVEDRVLSPVRVIEDGDVHTVIETLFGVADSKAYVRYILPKNGTAIDIDTGLFFSEKQQMVRLIFTHALPEDIKFEGQIMFGREGLMKEGRETVSQKWLAVHDKENALAIYRTGGYGASLNGRDIAVTLLRGAGYTASDFVMGKAYAADQWMPRMDQGMREFSLRLEGGKASILDIVDNKALVYNERPYALAYNPYGGGKKPGSFYTIDNESIVVSALKPAENGDGFILRLYETTGNIQNGILKVPALSIEDKISIGAGEIKTYRLKAGQLTEEKLLEGF